MRRAPKRQGKPPECALRRKLMTAICGISYHAHLMTQNQTNDWPRTSQWIAHLPGNHEKAMRCPHHQPRFLTARISKTNDFIKKFESPLMRGKGGNARDGLLCTRGFPIHRQSYCSPVLSCRLCLIKALLARLHTRRLEMLEDGRYVHDVLLGERIGQRLQSRSSPTHSLLTLASQTLSMKSHAGHCPSSAMLSMAPPKAGISATPV